MAGLTGREARLVTAASDLLDALVALKEQGFFQDRRPGDPVLTARLGPLSVAWVELAETVGEVMREASQAPPPLPPTSPEDVGRVVALERMAGGPVEVAFRVSPGGLTRADLVALATPVMDVVRLLMRQQLGVADRWEALETAIPVMVRLSETPGGPGARYARLTATAATLIVAMRQARALATDDSVSGNA